MTSLRHNALEADPQAAYLDAARACILDVGWRRTTLTEVARRAGVSRMTLYRAWPDMPAVLADLMTREWGEVVARAVAEADASAGARASAAERIVAEVVATSRALRENELFARIVELDPQILLPYLLTRRGRSQQAIAELTAARLREGQQDGSVRDGDPVTMARALLLAAHGFVLSLATMVDGEVTADDLDRELASLVRGLVSPVSTTPIRAGLDDVPASVDLLVVGLGVTGAGCALDAVARGLSVLAVEAHDLAWGTSRWSSKLVHGGLRYLAHGQLAVAHESAVERGVLMEVTAPHLTHALPMLLPLATSAGRGQAAFLRAGFGAGDLLRMAARTSAETLPRARAITATESRRLAPVLGGALRGGILAWDGQLEDDARLVTTIARTAAGLGAEIRTRARVLELHGRGARVRDELTGTTSEVRARAVVNATGVWAGDLVADVELRPSRGSHLVLHPEALPGLAVALTLRVPGERARFLNVVPQQEGLIYIGLTDVPVNGPVPDVADPGEEEIEQLLGTVSASLTRPLSRADVAGAYAGLRPLLSATGRTADLSRRHAVLTSPDGVVTVVGGKLTTYRRMAQDAVDAAVRLTGLDAAPCSTARLPLAGAASRVELTRLAETSRSPRLVRRFGTDAGLVLATARAATGLTDDQLVAPVADGTAVTLAELVFGVTHEGAHDVDDLLDRRTRVGLVAEQRALVEPSARRALQHALTSIR